MLHILAGIYFVIMLLAASAVIAGTMFANRDRILSALGSREPSIAPLPLSSDRMRRPARVVRMASPAPLLRMAA